MKKLLIFFLFFLITLIIVFFLFFRFEVNTSKGALYKTDRLTGKTYVIYANNIREVIDQKKLEVPKNLLGKISITNLEISDKSTYSHNEIDYKGTCSNNLSNEIKGLSIRFTFFKNDQQIHYITKRHSLKVSPNYSKMFSGKILIATKVLPKKKVIKHEVIEARYAK